MKVSGTITSIVQSKKNPKSFRISINDEFYGIYAEQKIGLKEGTNIEAEYTEKENFKNIDPKSIKIIKDDLTSTTITTQDKDSLIVKQACLKASSNYSNNVQENINNAKILFKSLRGEW